ncbi:MAG TPA: biotin/lipoyl-containing protein [Terriglobia bacterium]|nr:biotin/lipoyl-containing protein [Terriglobia bacterium]
MKIEIKIHSGSAAHDRQIELDPAGVRQAAAGRIEFVLDGAPATADWAEISPGVYSILAEGRSFELHVVEHPGHLGAHASTYEVKWGVRQYRMEILDPRRRRHSGPDGAHDGPQEILAPMPGKIVKILVAENQEVEQGQGLLVMEAMKMQNELRAPRAGSVERVYVNEGTGVETGFKLIRLA